MLARQLYRTLFFAPLLLSALLIAPLLLLHPALCDDAVSAACSWQVEFGTTLSALLASSHAFLSSFSYPEIAAYCTVTAAVAHFAFPYRFLHRTFSAARTAVVLGFAILSIFQADKALNNWTACASDRFANTSCEGGADWIFLYHAAPVVWLIATLFVPIGLAISVAHGILLGVLHGAREERRYP